MAIRPTPTNMPIRSHGWTGSCSYASERLQLEEPLVLAGDFNVIPTPADARNPGRWVRDALFLPRHAREFP